MVCLKGTVNNMAKVGKNIRLQRTKQGISQETLAEQLYVSRQTVSNYETGKSYPDIDMLVKIAEVFRINSVGRILHFRSVKSLKCLSVLKKIIILRRY